MARPVNAHLAMLVKRTLYRLKRDYGAPIEICKLISTGMDVRTGRRTLVKDVTRLRRAIVLPETLSRETKQSISLISSNKEFVTGGTFDAGTRTFIVDRRDCRHLPDLNADDWLVYDNTKYQIQKVQEYEPRAGWIITARKLAGDTPADAISVSVAQSLNLESDVSADLE